MLDVDAKPPKVQNWNIGVQRSLFDKYLVEVRYVGASATNLPRNVEANPAIYGPGATAQNADRRRLYANCPADGGACDFSTIAMLRSVARSRYDAGQFSLSRGFGDAVGFNVSYWLSRTIDHLSAMNLGGAAAKPLAGENDLAQNPFDLEAEWGPSLFDARHRLVASGSWLPRISTSAPAAVRVMFDEWQINGIATYNSGTPFTVSDSANVALQANSPPISGFPASRPNVVGDPNDGPKTVDAMDQPLGIPAAGPADAGRAVWKRGPQHRAWPVLHQHRPVVRAHVRDGRADAGCSSGPRRSTCSTTSTWGCRSPISTPPASGASCRRVRRA